MEITFDEDMLACYECGTTQKPSYEFKFKHMTHEMVLCKECIERLFYAITTIWGVEEGTIKLVPPLTLIKGKKCET